MRAFIAIELPQEIKDYLARLQAKLKKSGADIKWVEPQNIHLTLKFLGDIDDYALDKIKTIIDKDACLKNEFSLNLSELGTFPNITAPRVIWVGINEGSETIKQIAESLNKDITAIGIPQEDREFSCHITIGRSKSGLNRLQLMQLLKELSGKPQEENLGFTVRKITLFKSTLTAAGPVYEILKEANLKTN